MSKLTLNVGDKVRNIGNSARKGWIGVVAGDTRGVYAVYYAESGRTQTYDKQTAHLYLEKIESSCPCQQQVLKLDLSKIEERMTANAARGTPAYILEAMGKTLGFERLMVVHDEIQITQPKRRMLKKVRRNVITGKTQVDMVRELGNARGVQQFNTRCLGRSTGQALRVIGDAMCNPTTEIRIKDIDHAVSQGIGQRMTVNEHFRQLVKSLIGNMKGFTFTDTHIVFHPIVTEETYVETH